jgi:hypothetical protein
LNDPLHATLNHMIQSGSWSNPAMHTLLTDYAKFHLVLVIAGGCTVIVLGLLSIIFWMRWKRTPNGDKHQWTFAKKVYFSFGLLSTAVSLLLALIVAANATNAFDPVPGFSLLANSTTTSDSSQLGHALNAWITSGNSTVPPLIQQKVQDRLAWQRPKAIVSGILLILFVVLSFFLWNALLQKTKGKASKWQMKEATYFICGIATLTFSFFLLVLVLANMQGAIAPLTITVLGVSG